MPLQLRYAGVWIVCFINYQFPLERNCSWWVADLLDQYLITICLFHESSQVDPIVASFSGGAVGVISVLMLIEANNVEQQEKKRCKYCHGTGMFLLFEDLHSLNISQYLNHAHFRHILSFCSFWDLYCSNRVEVLVVMMKV